MSVLDALKAGPFREPAHVWLYEVRNATGYARAVTRYADALVVSVWPSRGIWIAGIEVKTDRGDWLAELKNPEKSAEIQRFCDYWWLAADPGVVRREEVPKQWGFYECAGNKAKRIVDAPKLEPEPLRKDFVASVLRSSAQKQDNLRGKIRDELFKEHAEKLATDNLDSLQEKINNLEHEKRCLTAELVQEKRRYSQFEASVRTFESETGVDLNLQPYSYRYIGPHWKLAQQLSQMNPEHLAENLEKIAEGLRTLEALKKKVG